MKKLSKEIIKLTGYINSAEIYIIKKYIIALEQLEEHTCIHTVDRATIRVKETAKKIKEML